MKNYAYGSRGYLEQKAQTAQINLDLINEAISARLEKGEIKAAEFALYAEIVASAEGAVNYAEKELTNFKEAE